MTLRRSQSRFESLERRRLLAAGDVDMTFGGGDGVVTADVGGDFETIEQLLHAPGGKILAFARTSAGGNLAVVRLNGDGTPDNGFGSNGVVVTSLPAPTIDEPGAVAVHTSGKFAVVYGDNGSNRPNGVAMFKADGSLDTAFSSDGLLPMDNAVVSFEGVGFQSDGRLIVAAMGFDLTNAPPDEPFNPGDYLDPVLVRRYGINGTLDTGFGTGTGAADGTTALMRADGLDDLIVASDGRILLGTHYRDEATQTTPAILGQEIFRLTAGGLLDDAFGTGGAILVGTVPEPSTTDFSESLDIDLLGDNSLLVLSQERQLELQLRKFNDDGEPFPGFASEFDRLGRFPQRVGVDGGGTIFLSDNGSVSRYSSSGSADYTYGIDGAAMVANGETALVNSDGTVLVGGSTVPEFNTSRDLAVTKLQGGDGAERRPTLNGKGTLMYRTTNDAEQISVSIRGRDGKLIVRCDGYAQGFAPSKVKRIAIWAYGGNDHLTVGAGVTRAVYCEGGTGDDTLEGGMAGDVFLGGDGKDRLYGYDGDDIMLGGGANDYLLGGAGKDDLFGNGGLDSLSGAGGNDRLFGGIGDADIVSGGSGTDSAADSPDDVYSSIETILTL